MERVAYPGLPLTPPARACEAANASFGGMISFLTKGGLDEARRIAERGRISSRSPRAWAASSRSSSTQA